MPWQFWLMLLGVVVMIVGAGAGAADKEGWALVLLMTGLFMSIVGGVMMPDPPMGRADAARATIAAATAVVPLATAESELRALERAAATAAAAVNGGGE